MSELADSIFKIMKENFFNELARYPLEVAWYNEHDEDELEAEELGRAKFYHWAKSLGLDVTIEWDDVQILIYMKKNIQFLKDYAEGKFDETI